MLLPNGKKYYYCKCKKSKTNYKEEEIISSALWKVNKLENDYSSFKNIIIQLLQSLKDIFRNILVFGKDKDKEIVITQIIDCYDNSLYNDSDITYITKDTSKGKEMIQYLEEKDYDIF